MANERITGVPRVCGPFFVVIAHVTLVTVEAVSDLLRGCEKIGTGTSRHPLFACFSAIRFGASPIFSQPQSMSTTLVYCLSQVISITANLPYIPLQS